MEENEKENYCNENVLNQNCIIIDIRDSNSYDLGHINGAINIPEDYLLQTNFEKDKMICLYCNSGKISEKYAKILQKNGINAVNLQGGYFAWLKNHLSEVNNLSAKQIEESIRKKFHKQLFSKFCKAINEFEMISPNDKIAVCISGGKDSMLMAKLFQELKMHNKFPFELVFLVMDPGYSKKNREIIEKNALLMNIPLTFFETNIFENVFNIEKSPCYICARMRRGYLYSKAKELGCNKIALGHHFDDVIETILMGMLYSGQMQTMMPKLHSSHFNGMQLIRPLYLIREEDIKKWCEYNSLKFIQCACKFTESCASESVSEQNKSKRLKVKHLIADLTKEDADVAMNIFNSSKNVNLSTLISFKDKKGEFHSFLDEF